LNQTRWDLNSDYSDRLLEHPKPTEHPSDIIFDVNLSDAVGRRMISFSFRVEPVPGKPLGLDPVSLAVQSIDSAGQPQDLVRRNSVAHGTPLGVPSDYVSETIPDNASRIRISFQGVARRFFRTFDQATASVCRICG
jgi:hypothetical protein